MNSRDSRFPNKFLILGLLFILTGIILILRTTGYLPSLGELWPVVLLVVGFSMLYMVWARQASESYIFLGMIFSMGGLFLLLFGTVFSEVPLSKVWPVLMGIIGISLIPYGYKKAGNGRIAFIVPGVTMVALSALFLPFSLELVQTSFKVFVAVWWPVLFLLFGAVFLYAYFRKKK